MKHREREEKMEEKNSFDTYLKEQFSIEAIDQIPAELEVPDFDFPIVED